MTTVNVNEDKYSVTVTEGATTVVTVKAPGPQGPGFPDGNLGDVTSSNTGASVVVNSGAITNAKVNDSAAIAGTKISPDFGSQNITTTGNAVFGGNLTVSGTTTTIDSTTLRVEDKNIELGKVGSPTDITADGGGITLLGDTNHTFNWVNATDSWTSSEHIALPDNKELKLGSAGEVRLFHTGSSTNFIVSQHFFNLQANGYFFYNQAGNETLLSLEQNGAVKLYFDNVMKAETSANGFDLPDNSKLQLGDSQDLQIYHDANGSFISHAATSGKLFIQTNSGSGIEINKGVSENIAKFIPDGSVELYHDAVKKFETTSNGVTVSGDLLVSKDGNTSFSLLDSGHGFSASQIKLSNGGRDLDIKAPKDIRLKPTDGESGIVIEANGTVELYHDNVKKAETTATGFNINGTCVTLGATHFGDVTFTGDSANIVFDKSDSALEFADNAKATFGADADLQIYHDSTQSIIADTGTGQLAIRGGTTVSISNASGTQVMANFINGGACNLFHSGSIKLTTTSLGIDVDGSVTANDIITAGALLHENDTDTLVHFSAADTIEFKTGGSSRLLVNNFAIQLGRDILSNGQRILLGDSSGSSDDRLCFGESQDLQLYHNSTDSYIDNETGILRIRNTGSNGSQIQLLSNNGGIKIQGTTGEQSIVCASNSGVELYHNNVKRCETSANGFNLPDNSKLQLGDSQDLEIFHDGSSHSYFRTTAGGIIVKSFADLQFRSDNIQIKSAALENYITCTANGSVELYYDGTKKLETTSSGITVQGSVTTEDMNMSNLNGTANEVDNTKGSWSIQEGADDLFIINRVSGKKYKFNLTEIS